MPYTEPRPTLHMLDGQSLISVCFVLDYIEFVFGDLTLAALADPLVLEGTGSSVGTGTRSPTDPGYSDALCALIGKLVRSTREGRERLEILFDDGIRIVIPLFGESAPGPEMATLSGRGTFIASWVRTD